MSISFPVFPKTSFHQYDIIFRFLTFHNTALGGIEICLPSQFLISYQDKISFIDTVLKKMANDPQWLEIKQRYQSPSYP